MYIRKSDINKIFNCFSLLYLHIHTIPEKCTNRIFQPCPMWFHSADFTNKINKSFSHKKVAEAVLFLLLSAFLL